MEDSYLKDRLGRQPRLSLRFRIPDKFRGYVCRGIDVGATARVCGGRACVRPCARRYVEQRRGPAELVNSRIPT